MADTVQAIIQRTKYAMILHLTTKGSDSKKSNGVIDVMITNPET